MNKFLAIVNGALAVFQASGGHTGMCALAVGVAIWCAIDAAREEAT